MVHRAARVVFVGVLFVVYQAACTTFGTGPEAAATPTGSEAVAKKDAAPMEAATATEAAAEA